VRYDQKGCQYIPHVRVMSEQPLEITTTIRPAQLHPLAKVNPSGTDRSRSGRAIHHDLGETGVHPVKCNGTVDARLVSGAHDLALAVRARRAGQRERGLPPASNPHGVAGAVRTRRRT